ncbi:MAG: hypothetical protein ACYS29_10220, partial [Planctomycetota bacterium]
MHRSLRLLMVFVLVVGGFGDDFAFASFPDSSTVGLWLFDEADYPHTTLTDASEYEKADLCLMDGGSIVAGQ